MKRSNQNCHYSPAQELINKKMETHYLELSVLVVLELELLSSSESDSTVLTDNFLACKLFCLDLDCVLVCLEGRGGESPLPESGDQEPVAW